MKPNHSRHRILKNRLKALAGLIIAGMIFFGWLVYQNAKKHNHNHVVDQVDVRERLPIKTK